MAETDDQFVPFYKNLEEFMSEPKVLKHRSTMHVNKDKQSTATHISIGQKYYISTLVSQNNDYNIYKGVDAEKSRWVSLYAKRIEHPFQFSSKVKEHLRAQLCPKVLWTGEISLSKTNYCFQVHESLGPSLTTVFEYKKQGPSDKQLLHLLFEMIKLVQKMNSVNLVCGELTPDLVIFHSSPQKNDLYLLNCFKLKKKKEVIKPICTKYCSRGAHLGRSITTKDDLESVCYILFDLFSQGQFLEEKGQSELEEAKLSMKIEQFVQDLPVIMMDFYHYVTSLNYNDEINFFYWKNKLMRLLTGEIINKPFGFLMKKEGTTEIAVSKWSSWVDEIQKSVESNQMNQYEESENMVRLTNIMKHSLQY